MKKIKMILVILILLIIYIYVCNICLLPNNFILMQGEEFRINTLFGISLKHSDTLQTISNINNQKVNQTGKLDLSLNLFDLFKVKNINVNVIPKTTVVPIGLAIGMKLYTDGVLVVGMSEIEGKKPYENSGIRQGDRIIEINENQIDSTEDLMDAVNECNGEKISVKYIREERTINTSIQPVKNSDNEYKIGLWVRDAAAGVGTLTFYEPTSGMFATLRTWNNRCRHIRINKNCKWRASYNKYIIN